MLKSILLFIPVLILVVGCSDPLSLEEQVHELTREFKTHGERGKELIIASQERIASIPEHIDAKYASYVQTIMAERTPEFIIGGSADLHDMVSRASGLVSFFMNKTLLKEAEALLSDDLDALIGYKEEYVGLQIRALEISQGVLKILEENEGLFQAQERQELTSVFEKYIQDYESSSIRILPIIEEFLVDSGSNSEEGHSQECPACYGSGLTDSGLIECARCGGDGLVESIFW